MTRGGTRSKRLVARLQPARLRPIRVTSSLLLLLLLRRRVRLLLDDVSRGHDPLRRHEPILERSSTCLFSVFVGNRSTYHRSLDEDSPRGVVPAEETHVARLLRRDGRELLELLRPLREDVQLLREVSELTRLGRGRTVSAGRRRSIRHGSRDS